MKHLVLLLVLVAFTVAAFAQNEGTATGATDTSKFAAALEAQIGCKGELQPAKAVRALQHAGIIPAKYYRSESTNYYSVNKPLTVFGFNAVAVVAFDPDLPFDRAPGTLPPVLLGILVAEPLKEVKAKLGYLEAGNVVIDQTDEGTQRKPRLRTEIYCAQ